MGLQKSKRGSPKEAGGGVGDEGVEKLELTQNR